MYWLEHFIVYVYPILEYNSVIRSANLRKDSDVIVKVQRRFANRLRGLKDLPYAERLQCLNIPREVPWYSNGVAAKDDDEEWLITVYKQKSGDKITVVKLRFTE